MRRRVPAGIIALLLLGACLSFCQGSSGPSGKGQAGGNNGAARGTPRLGDVTRVTGEGGYILHGWSAEKGLIALKEGTGEAFRIDPASKTLLGLGVAPREARPGLIVYRDQIYIAQPYGQRKISKGSDRYFAPAFSPDGSFVLFTGLSSGVHVVRAVDGEELFHDAGTEPSWSPDSRHILYEKTADDGAVILESDLFMAPLDGGEAVNLTKTPGKVERRPFFSPDGAFLAFDDSGAVFIADLVWHE